MKKIIIVLICVLMLVSVFSLGIISSAAPDTEMTPAGVCFSVSVESVAGGAEFTVSRSSRTGYLPRQQVTLRTVDLTAFGDIHYAQLLRGLVFDENEESQTVTVTEYTSAQMAENSRVNVVNLYQAGTTRS